MNGEAQDEIRAPSAEKLIEWTAVLSAAGLTYHAARSGRDWVLHVHPEQRESALREIQAYEDANADWPPASAGVAAETGPGHDTWAAAWGVIFLVWFYAWLGPFDAASAATRAGAADAGKIAAGEWWRVVTALTIHSDILHLAGNVLSLLLFSHAVCKMMGGGLGWLLILASGVTGNMITAFLAKPQHLSAGASTACFGALGILSAYQSVRLLRRSGEWRGVWSRTWLPVCAGLALLGLLGTGPESDLAAHAFGFMAGALMAIPFGRHGARGLPEWAQRALELVCITTVMLCWRIAFKSLG